MILEDVFILHLHYFKDFFFLHYFKDMYLKCFMYRTVETNFAFDHFEFRCSYIGLLFTIYIIFLDYFCITFLI